MNCGTTSLARSQKNTSTGSRKSTKQTKRKTTPISERFWPKVDNSAGPDQCWPWLRARFPDGYGKVMDDQQRMIGAHRVAFELTTGRSIPNGLCVCHRCDNRICVNPAHLFLGTASDNTRDMVAKGRAASAKLKPDDIPKIKELYASGLNQYQIADLFQVGQATISETLAGKIWQPFQEPSL